MPYAEAQKSLSSPAAVLASRQRHERIKGVNYHPGIPPGAAGLQDHLAADRRGAVLGGWDDARRDKIGSRCHIQAMSNSARPVPDDDAAAFLAAVDAGIADADAGRTVPYEDVRRWLLSWGPISVPA